MIEPHPTVPHVWLLSADPTFPRPHVGVLGSLHGNERCGLSVIERLRAEASSFAKQLRQGTLVLVHGNPRATEQNRRFTEGGVDINRLFAFGYEHDLAREAWTYEHHRALALRPVLSQLDAAIDLHSATHPTEPFVISGRSERARERAVRLGLRAVFGWEGPGMLMDHVAIGDLVNRALPTVAVECGQHEAETTAENAWRATLAFLATLDVFDFEVGERGHSYELFGRIVKPSVNFALSRDFDGFDKLEPGELLGSGDGISVRVDRETHLILPTATAQRGEDLVFLAAQIT